MIKRLTKSELEVIKDDPVRPHIPASQRIGFNREVLSYIVDDEHSAIVCVAYCEGVPTTEEEMDLLSQSNEPDTAVFYTVWSYKRGYGRTIINKALEELQNSKMKRAVTLSPLTTMAERFHLRNGAKLIGKYNNCQNFEYEIPKEEVHPITNEMTQGTRMDDNWYYFKKEE